jgi:hypothetical protein
LLCQFQASRQASSIVSSARQPNSFSATFGPAIDYVLRRFWVEQYGGIENLNSELSKRSAYYENKIFTKSGN